MTVELVRGQNHPLPGTRLEVRVSAGGPVVAGVTLDGGGGRLCGADRFAHPGSPRLPGVEVPRQAAAEHRLAVDLEALPAGAHRVNVLLALPTGAGGPLSFGALPAPRAAVTTADGTGIAGYTVAGLGSESAVVAVELYLRQGVWKVRAVGQGYAGGLAAMLEDQGLPRARELAAAVQEAVARRAARSVAPPRTADTGRSRRAVPAGSTGRPGPAPEPAAPAVPPPAAGRPVRWCGPWR
ncbi:TerD family protein, partial [Streptomyces sp. URMC 125]|uniref:TerD family protein n=1 Tax=Streptomyces sp. URMC 125 TaxID=3423419 RepID=UPI003F1E2FBD